MHRPVISPPRPPAPLRSPWTGYRRPPKGPTAGSFTIRYSSWRWAAKTTRPQRWPSIGPAFCWTSSSAGRSTRSGSWPAPPSATVPGHIRSYCAPKRMVCMVQKFLPMRKSYRYLFLFFIMVFPPSSFKLCISFILLKFHFWFNISYIHNAIDFPLEKKKISTQNLTQSILYNFWILISRAFTTGAAKHYGALTDIYRDIYKRKVFCFFTFLKYKSYNQGAVNHLLKAALKYYL